jgi:hypothetical protein
MNVMHTFYHAGGVGASCGVIYTLSDMNLKADSNHRKQHSSTNAGPHFRLAVFADRLVPLNEFFACRAPSEFPLDLTQRLVKIDNEEKYGKQGAEQAPADDVSPPVGSQAAADHTRYENDQKQKYYRLDIVNHGINLLFIVCRLVPRICR